MSVLEIVIRIGATIAVAGFIVMIVALLVFLWRA